MQRLLRQARPEWSRDAEYYIESLFVRFISGLSDPDHAKVTGQAWKAGSSMADLFMAIDQHDKKILLAGRRPRVDRNTVKCYRCQVIGHFTAECKAEKPVMRSDFP